MEDTLIEYNTAVLAKEKGFDWEVIQYYVKSKELCPIENIEGGIIEGNYLYYDFNSFGKDYYSFRDKLEEHISAPTQSLLAKWLREEHGIHVNPIPFRDFPDNEITGYYVGEIYNSNGKELYSGDDTYPTFEQAYEKGLQEALKLIK